MKNIFSLIVLAFLFSGCIKNNQDPSWIEIDTWELEANSNSVYETGELTSNITDAWVYMDGEAIGVFEFIMFVF